ncbi:beta-galactosidase [Metabacillus idriensis]|uniref:beta-galactosidase n=1 Tax=Metabacillus idriensis TaxID=324768 RepID=UPI003D290954
MIEIKNKQIMIDGKPELLMCGEIHYYRLDRGDWQDRIDKLKQSGCNAVATYVPWLCHEPSEGEFDLTGKTRPELDLAAYIDLCKENGLYFFVRPGPFIMAEMKNEGLPYWVYEKHPEIIPSGWDGNPATTKTVDYLAPGFLKDVRNWYKAVMEIVTPRLHTNGGNIIAFQLDNEVGMLSWVSNCPDLTDHLLQDFRHWLKNRYDSSMLLARYPFDLNDHETANSLLRSPQEEFAGELLHDLGYYMRNRFARYIAVLREYAEEFGARDIPFVVNIHGTGGGRGFTYPIGISQLYESYTQAPGYISGSDIYFGDLDMNTFQDLYLINGFMDSVHLEDQPLTSVEFNCGDGNFGNTFGGRYDPSAVDFKTRMCVAQGNRLINYYLFAGGKNYRFDTELKDGNDRVAFTGEHHGFAAPVGPEGKLNYTYPKMASVIQAMMAVSDKIAAMNEEHDEVSFAFIPDYYMTEYRYPNSKLMEDIVRNLEANRASGSWEIMARSMLLLGYRFTSADIQNRELTPAKTKVLALPSARYMSADIQKKLVTYMNEGGRILLYGEVPMFDMEGKPCTILADTLGVKEKSIHRDSGSYFLSLQAENWAAGRPEVRSHFAQVFDAGDTTPILKVYGTDEVCGFEARVGDGTAVVLSTAYPCDLTFFKMIFEQLGVTPKLVHDCEEHGIFMTSTANEAGERFIHLLNLDGFDKNVHIYDQGEVMFEGKEIVLGRKEGLMLPVQLEVEVGKIVFSTAEIVGRSENAIVFRLTQPEDIIVFETDRDILSSEEYEVASSGNQKTVRSKKHSRVDDQLRVLFA